MHSLALIRFVTDLADQTVILPLITAVLLLLIAVGELRAAAWWAAAMALSLGGTLIAKLVFIPCGHLLPALAVQSPSGHTAAAAAAYSGLMMLAAQATRAPGGRYVALGLGAVIVALVAVSRVMLHAHTVEETLVGAAIGAVAPLMLILPQPLFVGGRIVRRRWLFALPLLIIPLTISGQAHVEGWIQAFAWHSAHLLQVCGA
jgi:membrane-associated phospholipid phosphatase